ncbi:MAG: alpha/beta fold hydrolase [Candidatus Puniceispirillales bacterium]|nr:alpha/beta hydrolase [Pseudomonadota bacterium]
MQITINDADIFVSTGGREPDKDAPVLLFIHGSGQTHLTWLLQARVFANRGWSVMAPDLPGHGLSKGSPLTSIEDLADWCHDLICQAGHKKVTVVGHSQGGLVALELARRYPDVIAGIGLIALALTIPVNPQLINMAEHNEPAAFNAMVRTGHGRDGAFHDHTMPGNSHINLGKRIMASNDEGVLAIDLKACDAYQGGETAAASITQPALIILAKEDKMTPSKRGYELAKAIPHAELVVIENAGHMLPVERSDDVNKSLRRLFEKTGA